MSDVGAGRRDRWHPRLRWTIETLWERSDLVRVVDDGRVPPGFRSVASFVVLPSLARARFLVPGDAPRAAVAALRSYNSLRPAPARLARRAVAAAAGSRLGRRALRHRLEICVSQGVTRDALAGVWFEEHLRRDVFAGRPLVSAVGVGRQGPNRKPVLQIFSPDGDALGYAKLGWNGYTRGLVRNESEMLARCTASPVPGLWTPAVLDRGEWDGLEVGVVSPLPAEARRVDPSEGPPLHVARGIAELVGPPIELPLAESPYFRGIEAELEDAEPSPARALASRLAGLESRVRFGCWHGDLTPWNVASTTRGLAAWDWEHGGVAAPVGFDLLHWLVSVPFVRERAELPVAFARARAQSPGALAAVGADPASSGVLTALYGLELAARARRAARSGAGRNDRLARGLDVVLAELRSELTSERRATD